MMLRLVWDECKEVMLDREGSERKNDRKLLNVNIAQYFVRAPATQQPDTVWIHIGTEEGHGTAGAQGANGDVGGFDADKVA
jgi:hypothetical protein